MVIGLTLGLYFLRRFAQSIIGVFLAFFSFVYLVDFIELIRRAGEAPTATTWRLAELSLFRVPAVTEQIVPFAVLFGSLWAFLNLNRKLELVVTRSAGISAWQFGAPAFVVAFLIGLFAMTVYNPVAANLKRQADALEGRLFGRDGVGSGETGLWVRQKSVDGEAILRAEKTVRRGAAFGGVTAFVFDQEGRFSERIEAPNADLKGGFWQFSNARVLMPDSEPAEYETYLLATNLTAEQVNESLTASDTVSFWELPALVDRLELAGLDATRYRLRYQSLIARPMLLVAMVLLAASVSLRFFRFGGVARMVLGGVLAGFMLYVATEVAEDLGSAGILSAFSASWTPAIVGGLLGALALLNQEDG